MATYKSQYTGQQIDQAVGNALNKDTSTLSNDVNHIPASSVVKSALNTLTGRARRNISSDLSNLVTAVAEQNLKKYGYAIGDYFIGPSGYKYILADLDTFYGGYNNSAVLGTHHITLVVDTDQNVKWNSSDSTTTGYAGSNLHSYMVNTVLPNVKTDVSSLFGAWADHLLSHQKLYSTNTSAWAWSSDQYISALTSVQFHGSPIGDMNFYQTGEGNKPLEVFQKFFYPEIFGNYTVWLRSVVSASCPCLAGARGQADGATAASNSLGAVGLIIFH